MCSRARVVWNVGRGEQSCLEGDTGTDSRGRAGRGIPGRGNYHKAAVGQACFYKARKARGAGQEVRSGLWQRPGDEQGFAGLLRTLVFALKQMGSQFEVLSRRII